MKLLLQKFLLAAFSFGMAAGAMGQDIQKLLTEGQTAFMRGDLVAAKRAFALASKVDSKNPIVIGYLKQIAAAEAKTPTSPAVERELQKLIIPQMQLKDATFASALDFLKKKATEISGGKQSINFVLKMPPEQQNIPVTLSLSEIPFTEALRYITELANAKVEYQKYAIVIHSGGATEPAPTPVTPPEAGQ